MDLKLLYNGTNTDFSYQQLQDQVFGLEHYLVSMDNCRELLFNQKFSYGHFSYIDSERTVENKKGSSHVLEEGWDIAFNYDNVMLNIEEQKVVSIVNDRENSRDGLIAGITVGVTPNFDVAYKTVDRDLVVNNNECFEDFDDWTLAYKADDFSADVTMHDGFGGTREAPQAIHDLIYGIGYNFNSGQQLSIDYSDGLNVDTWDIYLRNIMKEFPFGIRRFERTTAYGDTSKWLVYLPQTPMFSDNFMLDAEYGCEEISNSSNDGQKEHLQVNTEIGGVRVAMLENGDSIKDEQSRAFSFNVDVDSCEVSGQYYNNRVAESLNARILFGLARNFGDGGQILWYLQDDVISKIFTHDKAFTDSHSDQLMVAIEFALAKHSSDATSARSKEAAKSKILTEKQPPKNPILGYKVRVKREKEGGFLTKKQLL